jgi:hypothetical protein
MIFVSGSSVGTANAWRNTVAYETQIMTRLVMAIRRFDLPVNQLTHWKAAQGYSMSL